MENIIRNPGLQHLVEKIFWNLDVEDLKICAYINQSCKQILAEPKLWLKKFVSLSKKNQKDWIKVIKKMKNSDKRNAIISYLQRNLKKGAVDLPIYSSRSVQNTLRKEIFKRCKMVNASDENIEIVKILAPLTNNPNAPNKDKDTAIHNAAFNGHIEMIKILLPFIENPNAPNCCGSTPIHCAAESGQKEVIKILASLTDNPNAPNNKGMTPIHMAARNGHTDFVQILAPLTENPNAANVFGITPIYQAVPKGHIEIVKILAPLTKNPNAPPNKEADTPIYKAALLGHTEIVKLLAPMIDNPNAPNIKGKTPSSVAKNEEIRRILMSSKKCNASIEPSRKKAKKF